MTMRVGTFAGSHGDFQTASEEHAGHGPHPAVSPDQSSSTQSGSTQVTDSPASGLANLQRIGLGGTQVTDLPAVSPHQSSSPQSRSTQVTDFTCCQPSPISKRSLWKARGHGPHPAVSPHQSPNARSEEHAGHRPHPAISPDSLQVLNLGARRSQTSPAISPDQSSSAQSGRHAGHRLHPLSSTCLSRRGQPT